MSNTLFTNFKRRRSIVSYTAGRYIPGAAAPDQRIRSSEAYGLADRQSVKKPIDAFLVLSRPFLNALTVVESIRPYTLVETVPSVNDSFTEKVASHIQAAEWPLVRVLSLKVNMLSKLITDHPLYILNTCSRSALLRLSSVTTIQGAPIFFHNDNCLRSGIILVNLCWTRPNKCLSLL